MGWRYRGIISDSESGGDGQTRHYDYVQGHFELCVPKLGCPTVYYPRIKKWQYGDGTHRYEAKK